MTIDVTDRDTGSIQQAPLSLEGETAYHEICLELAPGASAVQVIVRDGENVAAAIEVTASRGENISVELRRDSAGTIRAAARNRDFLVLPDEEPPERLILKPPHTDELDLAVLVDGSCLHPIGGQDAIGLEYLLAPALAKEWHALVSSIADFATTISGKYRNVWTTAMAFGDEPMPSLANSLLMPSYLIYPLNADNRRFVPSSANQIAAELSGQLRKLPHSPGGDFVDALADGLRACRQLSWRQNSRKLLVLFGQSPGYSVLNAPEEITNLVPRTVCVEEEIEALHRKGVEVITIFHHPAEAEERYAVNLPSILQHSREQYEAQASLREWGISSPPIDVQSLASVWLNPPVSIARGPSPGLLVNS